MSKKLVVGFIGLLVFMMFGSSAWAQFKTNVSGGGTSLTINQVSPGLVDLVFGGVFQVYQGQKAPAGVKVSWEGPDASGKGTVQHVIDPEAMKGLQHCLTGVGRGGWAIQDGRLNPEKGVHCVPAANTVVHRISVTGSNACFGIIPVTATTDMRFVSWSSHPEGPTKQYFYRATGEKDMVTLLCVDGNGTVSPPTTSAQLDKYGKYYQAVTAQ